MKTEAFPMTLCAIWAVSLIAIFGADCFAEDPPIEKPKQQEKVLILHKGDPFPPVGVLYSYDSKETEADFDRRRKEQEAKTVRKEDVTGVLPVKNGPPNAQFLSCPLVR